jgi:hypothetical protein
LPVVGPVQAPVGKLVPGEPLFRQASGPVLLPGRPKGSTPAENP